MKDCACKAWVKDCACKAYNSKNPALLTLMWIKLREQIKARENGNVGFNSGEKLLKVILLKGRK